MGTATSNTRSKSSLLNFVKHELDRKHPLDSFVVSFNPWWFNSRDDLAAQFLAQFRRQLRVGDRFLMPASATGPFATT